MIALLEPWRRLLSPVFLHGDRVPESGPLLFVGNHTVHGLFDVPFLVRELYVEHGHYMRSLADHVHFKVPIWRSFVQHFGGVDGNRENCAALMRAGESILVFPGGAREVAKRKGERYRLIWKKRTGFARLALANNCTIVPFSGIGVEDALDIHVDADDVMASPLGRLIEGMGIRSDLLLPLTTGLGPTPIPRPERLYFHFSQPIHPRDFEDDDEDAAAWALREKVRESVEAGIAELLEHRETDPLRKLSARVKNKLTP